MPPARLELTAPGLGILCSIHLSYGGIRINYSDRSVTSTTESKPRLAPKVNQIPTKSQHNGFSHSLVFLVMRPKRLGSSLSNRRNISFIRAGAISAWIIARSSSARTLPRSTGCGVSLSGSKKIGSSGLGSRPNFWIKQAHDRISVELISRHVTLGVGTGLMILCQRKSCANTES